MSLSMFAEYQRWSLNVDMAEYSLRGPEQAASIMPAPHCLIIRVLLPNLHQADAILCKPLHHTKWRLWLNGCLKYSSNRLARIIPDMPQSYILVNFNGAKIIEIVAYCNYIRVRVCVAKVWYLRPNSCWLIQGWDNLFWHSYF